MVQNINVDISAINETVSEAFNDVNAAGQSLQENLDDVQQELTQIGRTSNIADESLDNVKTASNKLSRAQAAAKEAGETLESTLEKVASGSITAAEAQDRLDNAAKSVAGANRTAASASESLNDQLQEIIANTTMTDAATKRVSATFGVAAGSANRFRENVSDAAGAASRATVANERLDNSLNDVGRSAAGAAAGMGAANSQMGLMQALAEGSALQFGSLSLNIGSFNIALKQLALQIPAILVGMGAWIALLTSLAAGLMTAVTAMGAFMGAGLVGYLEQVENQNEGIEGTFEAMQVVLDSIGDLFYEALQPIMQEGEVNMFIAAVEKAADVLNVIAQWLADNKETFTDFWSEASFNLNVFLDSMLTAFEAIEPYLIDLINYLGEGLPKAIANFAQISANLLPHIKNIIGAVRSLFNELIGFASIVLTGVTPVIVGLVHALDTLFAIINTIPDGVLAGVVAFTALTLVMAKMATTAVTLYTAFGTMAGKIATLTAQGSTAAGTLNGLGHTIAQVGSADHPFGAVDGLKAMKLQAQAAGHAFVSTATSIYASAKTAAVGIGSMALQAGRSAASLMSSGIAALFSASTYQIAATKAWGLLKGLGSTIAGLFSSVAGFLASATAAGAASVAYTAATVAAKALLAALGIGLIIAVAQALWQLVSGGEGAAGMMERLGGAIETFKNIASEFITPVMNIIDSLFGLIMSFAKPWQALAEALGLTSDKGGESSSMLSKLGSVMVGLARAIATPLRMLDLLLRILTAIVESAGVAIFRALGKFLAECGRQLKELIMMIPWVEELVWLFGKMADALGDAADRMGELKEDAQGWMDSKLGEMGVEGPNQKTRAARDEQEKDKKKEPETTQYEPNVNMSFEERVEQNVDVQADPEEQESMKRHVKDAMNEANAIQRRREGR